MHDIIICLFYHQATFSSAITYSPSSPHSPTLSFPSHKTPFSHSSTVFSTFTLFHSHFLLPFFMLGGHSPVKEFNMQLLYEKPIAYVWVYWARNLSARTANAIESAGAIYHTGSYLFLPLSCSLSLSLLLTLPSLALSLFKPRFQAATKSGQL